MTADERNAVVQELQARAEKSGDTLEKIILEETAREMAANPLSGVQQVAVAAEKAAYRRLVGELGLTGLRINEPFPAQTGNRLIGLVAFGAGVVIGIGIGYLAAAVVDEAASAVRAA